MWCKFLFYFVVLMFACGKDITNYTLNFVPPVNNFISSIDLTGQVFKQLPHNAFQYLSSQLNISVIILKYCQISHIDAGAFINLHNLTYLYLSHNEINHIPSESFQDMKQIQYIDLKFNKIEILETGLFQNLESLRVILLTDNQIYNIEADTFKNTPSLSHIDLSNNAMEYFNVSFKDHFNKVQYLLLHGNPWNCDCNFIELYNFFQTSREINYPIIPQCQSPQRLMGRNWENLTRTDLQCELQIIEPSDEIRVSTVGSQLTLSCATPGLLKPDIKWRNGSADIAPDRYSSSSYRHVHHVNYTFKVQQYDAGVYQCVAESKNAQLEANVTVLVDNGLNQAPVILAVIITDRETNEEGTNMTLACKVFSKPYPKLSWFYQSSKYEESINLPVIISARMESNENIYWCNTTVVISGQNPKGLYTCEASNYLKTRQFSIPQNTTERVFKPWKEIVFETTEAVIIPEPGPILGWVLGSLVAIEIFSILLVIIITILAVKYILRRCIRIHQRNKDNTSESSTRPLTMDGTEFLSRQSSEDNAVECGQKQ